MHKSSEVAIGDVIIGGNQPLVIQSMTNTNTLNTEATVAQTMQLVKAGCQLVRITAQGVREANHLAVIKKELSKKGINIPLVADIHFQPKAAEVAARMVEKVRINPGNYTDKRRNKTGFSEREYGLELEKISERLFPLIKICKEYGTAIRIGTNHGSLSERILFKYGNTVRGMVASTLEFVEIFRDFGFHNLVLSIKVSHVPTMIAANHLLVKEMVDRSYYYPLHLGVTEAGAGEAARVKSAAGIGSLLATGIGDTLRVSLTEDPVQEIPFAKKLALLYAKEKFPEKMPVSYPDYFKKETSETKSSHSSYPLVFSSTPTANTDFYQDKDRFVSKTGQSIQLKPVLSTEKMPVMKFSYSGIKEEELLIRSAVDCTLAMEKRKIAGLWIENGNPASVIKCTALSLEILQALQLRFSKTEFIACPSCGRTRFDILAELQKVQAALPHLKNLKIAVMGCMVNGIGEMAGADYGYVGVGVGKVTLYKGKEIAVKNIPENIAVERLVQLIKSNGDWEEEVDKTAGSL